ncbi:hypothetical protein D3C77_541470 [compost metagenome]
MLVTPRFAAIACQPVKGAVLYETTLHGCVQWRIEGQGNRPGRVHLHSRSSGRKLRGGRQQLGGLRRWHRDDHSAERAVAAAFGVLQVPIVFATKDFGNPAREVDCHVFEQAPGDCTHARHADPAGLFVWGRAQDTVLIVVELRLPLGDPAGCHPLLNLLDKAPVAGGEILCTEIQGTGITAFAGHTAAAAVALVEQVDSLPGFLQCLGR